MPTFELPDDVKAAKTNASNLAGVAVDAQSGEFTIGDILQKKVQDAYGDNVDITSGLNTNQANYLSAPSEARANYLDPNSPDYQPNPFAADRLVQRSTNNALIPYLASSQLYGQRLGNISDLIGAGTNAYGAYSSAAQGNAANAQNLYSQLLNEYTTMEGLRQSERGLDIQQQNADKPAGGGSAFPDIAAIFEQFANLVNGGGGQGEQKPNWNPGPVSSLSPGGEWFWDFESTDWVPIID